MSYDIRSTTYFLFVWTGYVQHCVVLWGTSQNDFSLIHAASSLPHKTCRPLRRASGVSTGTLLSLACASGIFAVGVGFVAGYKASPSFAYMRIPSLS